MAVCFYPIKITDINSSKKNNKFRFISHTILLYYINTEALIEILRYILTGYCDVSILGYEKKYQKYWFKKYTKTDCELHIEIEIVYKDYNLSQIKIAPLIGDSININSFILHLNSILHAYQNTNLIKKCFDRCVI